MSNACLLRVRSLHAASVHARKCCVSNLCHFLSSNLYFLFHHQRPEVCSGGSQPVVFIAVDGHGSCEQDRPLFPHPTDEARVVTSVVIFSSFFVVSFILVQYIKEVAHAARKARRKVRTKKVESCLFALRLVFFVGSPFITLNLVAPQSLSTHVIELDRATEAMGKAEESSASHLTKMGATTPAGSSSLHSVGVVRGQELSSALNVEMAEGIHSDVAEGEGKAKNSRGTRVSKKQSFALGSSKVTPVEALEARTSVPAGEDKSAEEATVDQFIAEEQLNRDTVELSVLQGQVVPPALTSSEHLAHNWQHDKQGEMKVKSKGPDAETDSLHQGHQGHKKHQEHHQHRDHKGEMKARAAVEDKPKVFAHPHHSPHPRQGQSHKKSHGHYNEEREATGQTPKVEGTCSSSPSHRGHRQRHHHHSHHQGEQGKTKENKIARGQDLNSDEHVERHTTHRKKKKHHKKKG